MWISAEQLGPVLKHHWFMTKYTESTINYTLYNNRNRVKVYTLRYNLRSPDYSHESMIDDMMKRVMNQFPKAESVMGSFEYDMLLMNNNNKEDAPSYYLWRANSNQQRASSVKETLLKKEYHQLYLFGLKSTEADMSELNLEFQNSNVVIADLLTIVFTFSSV